MLLQLGFAGLGVNSDTVNSWRAGVGVPCCCAQGWVLSLALLSGC